MLIIVSLELFARRLLVSFRQWWRCRLECRELMYQSPIWGTCLQDRPRPGTESTPSRTRGNLPRPPFRNPPRPPGTSGPAETVSGIWQSFPTWLPQHRVHSLQVPSWTCPNLQDPHRNLLRLPEGRVPSRDPRPLSRPPQDLESTPSRTPQELPRRPGTEWTLKNELQKVQRVEFFSPTGYLL